MTAVHVYLIDGFQNDTVVARVDGLEVFAKKDVSTKRLISLADEFSFEVSNGPVQLDIQLPGRMLATNIDVDPQRSCYIAVSVEGNRLTHFASQKPLGFL
jgi:hypothetical protein